jgi:hypothetical protein
MALDTKDKPEDKKIKIAHLREKHQPIFDKLSIPDASFIPKFAYLPKTGAPEKVIAFFPSEINKGNDVYTEFVSIDYDPEDAERRLWKWKFNPQFDTEYEKSTPHPVTGHSRYLIPVNELIHVTLDKADGTQEKIEFPLPDPDQDCPMDAMTLRDYAAIKLKAPVSHKPWLNDIIKKL